MQTWILCIKFLVCPLGLMLWLNFTLLLIFSTRFEKRKKITEKIIAFCLKMASKSYLESNYISLQWRPIKMLRCVNE